ncbi:MAG TPA: hypothetical protein VMH03_15490 [Terriglobales bacterium]|nr:hypothetical protein [Terriglobales bacterium]
MRHWYLLIFTWLLLSGAGYAQFLTGNVFGGYSYGNADYLPNRVSINGWEASGEAKFLPFLGVVADFGGQYGSPNFTIQSPCPVTNAFSCLPPQHPQTATISITQYSFLFGPRFSIQVKKLRPFAHALFGASHLYEHTPLVSSTDTAFSYALGMGLDYRFNHRFGWRVQGDALETQFFNAWQTNLRVSTGLVISF